MLILKKSRSNGIFLFILLFFILGNDNINSQDKKIPDNIKNHELNIIINSNNYNEISRKLQDYYGKEYRNDLIDFFINTANNEKIPDSTRIFLYSQLLSFGRFEYLKKIIDFDSKDKKEQGEIKDYKIRVISEAFFSYHYNTNENKKLWDYSYWSWCVTDSLNSYLDINHTPDLLYDGDLKTTWRIKDLKNKEECILYLPAPGDKNNKIKVLSGNHENNNLFNKYYRPKKIRLTLRGYTYMNNKESKNENIYQKEYSLRDSKEYQEVIFKPSVLSGIFENYNSYMIKLEILDFFKGEISNCDIAELRVVSME